MVSSKATTVKEYLASLPAERREDVETVRQLILANLPPGYEEGMDFGMINYFIPLERYPVTYNGHPLGIVALASQKQYMAVYLMGLTMDLAERKAFELAWKKSGKKLDLGKICLRFKSADELALDVLAREIARVTPEQHIAHYEKERGLAGGGKPEAKKTVKKAGSGSAAAKASSRVKRS